MTPEQFDALAALIHLRQSASRDAARLVLVDGLSVIDAAARAGITQQGANQAVLRCKRALELARAAVLWRRSWNLAIPQVLRYILR